MWIVKQSIQMSLSKMSWFSFFPLGSKLSTKAELWSWLKYGKRASNKWSIHNWLMFIICINKLNLKIIKKTTKWLCCQPNIRCTTLLPSFFPKFEALFFNSDYLLMIQSTVGCQPLLFSIFLAIVGYHLEKTMRLLRRSTNRSIFDFFIRAEMLMSQAVWHRSKQMAVGKSNVWRVRRLG